MDQLKLGKYLIPIKIAITQSEQIKGLMGETKRIAMAFPSKPSRRRFWMRETPLPLDIIFCLGGKVIEICTGVPFDENPVGSKLSDLVVELPSGTADELNIKVGCSVQLCYSLESCAKSFENFLARS